MINKEWCSVKKCLTCNDELINAHRNRKYCNDVCKLFAQKQKTVKYICRYCKEEKDIYIHQVNKEKGNYCSYGCAAKGREKVNKD